MSKRFNNPAPGKTAVKGKGYSIVDLLPYSKFASIVLPDGSGSFVYYQAVDGSICETSTYLGSAWTNKVIMEGEDVSRGTPLAAVSWSGNDNGQHFRLYYLARDYTLSEMMFENGVWKGGDPLDWEVVKVAPFSQLGAVAYDNGNQIRLYFQKPRPYCVQEMICTNGKWTKGFQFWQTLCALPGTALSFISLNSVTEKMPSIRGYVQVGDGHLHELSYDDGGWNAANWGAKSNVFIIDAMDVAFRTPIAATAASEGQHGNGKDHAVFWVTNKGYVVGTTCRSGIWGDARRIDDQAVVPGGGLTVGSFSKYSNMDEVRVYANHPQNIIAEVMHRDGKWVPHDDERQYMFPPDCDMSHSMLVYHQEEIGLTGNVEGSGQQLKVLDDEGELLAM